MSQPGHPTAPLQVLVPVDGRVVALADVPDPVFAEAIVGPGIAVDPVREGQVSAVSPVTGTLVKLYPHAFVVVAEDGRAVLVHLGLDTVQLRGAGFELHAQEKDTVEAGQPLVSWDPGQVEAGGRSPLCPVIALDGAGATLEMGPAPGEQVRARQTLFTWA